MKRIGDYFNILGDAARSKAFTPDPAKLPDSTRSAYGSVRDANRAIRRVNAEAAAAREKIDGDGDLNANAKRRKHEEVKTKSAEAIAGMVGKAKVEIEAFRAVTTEQVRTAQHRDPMALPHIDWSRITSGADTEMAKINHALLKRTDMMVRTAARDRVDRILDRVLDPNHDVGVRCDALMKAHERVLGVDDPMLLREFETYGRQRVEAEGGKTANDVLTAAIEAVAEERVGDDERLLLDHVDALTTAELFLDQAEMDPRMLIQAEQFLGPVLAGKD